MESVASPGVTFRLLDGGQVVEHEDELRALRREVYGENGESSSPAGQFRVQRRQPGFLLAEATAEHPAARSRSPDWRSAPHGAGRASPRPWSASF